MLKSCWNWLYFALCYWCVCLRCFYCGERTTFTVLWTNQTLSLCLLCFVTLAAMTAVCEIFNLLHFRSTAQGGGHGPMVNTSLDVYKLLVWPGSTPRLCRMTCHSRIDLLSDAWTGRYDSAICCSKMSKNVYFAAADCSIIPSGSCVAELS